MESDTPARDPNDINQTAAYAAALRSAGGRLNLTPKAPKQDVFAKTPADEAEELTKWYEMNPNKGIDLSSPDAKEHWQKLVTGMNKRHTDWAETIGEVGGMIAHLPADLVEGMVEDPNPLVWGASAAEGVTRMMRDMWGMATESENPTSPVFHLRSVFRAIKSGKASQNWQEEAQQWNETRKFLFDSQKIQQGDMSVFEALPYVNMSEATAQKLRSFSNPKIAHAMSFIGLELGSLVAAPFTGGASQALAIGTAARLGRAGAASAQKASLYGKAMGTLTEAGKKLDALAAGATQRAVGHVATGLSKAISIPANAVEGLVGGTIESISARSGYGAEHLRNIAATQAINGMGDIGAGQIRQTVGYLGSMGLRTTAELLGEVGEQSLMLANGVITAEQVNGLTVLERLAGNKMLSPSASKTAKALNVIVDPMLQMSTAALKHAYKDSLLFAGLGYMNDRERGMVSGATMGMVWGGYSGAFRHMWGNVNGFVQHENFIRDFDNNFLPKLDGFSPEFANFARSIIQDADAGKSSRVSSNTRAVIQMAHTILDPKQKKSIIAGTLPFKEMVALLESKGVKDASSQLARSGRGQFSLVATGDGLVPMLWLNPDLYRPADFGHEALGHMLSYTLNERGQIGSHLLEFFGTGENKGVWSDKYMAETSALRNSLEVAIEQHGTSKGIDFVKARALEIYNAGPEQKGSVAYFQNALNQLRSTAYGSDYAFFHQQEKRGNDLVQKPFTVGEIHRPEIAPDHFDRPLNYIFEEFISGHAENMFIHTNLQDLNLSADQKPLRMYFERKFLERLSRTATELEMAGVRARYGAPLTKDGRPTIQAEIYDDGIYKRAPQMDSMLRNMVDAAKNTNDAPVQNLSPEMQLAVAKKHRKEHLFNIRGTGATLKGEKERNEMSTKSSKGAFDIIDQLPDELKPKISVDEHGNRTADVYTMKDEVLDSLADSGFLDPESVRVAKAFRDTYMQYEASGFTSGNMFYGQNLGSSHRTAVGNLFKRIFGDDVPVTHRVFVPFELKLYYRTTDGTGKQLRSPRGGYVATVMDYTAVHRRQMKMWSRPDVKALFTGLGEFNEFFHEYMMNMLREPSSRVDSASLFRPKFGANAEKVRDIMYETFGASKRSDESYINPPREGYFSSHENPNFPIHSLRLENLVGVERVASAPFPYHHGRSYEPLRRNLSVAGFEEISANVFANGQGYRVIRERATESSGWKVFSPFGAMVGKYKDKDKAFKSAQKHLRTAMNPADVLALPTDESWTQMNRSERLQQIQESGNKFREYHASKSVLVRNTSLQIGPVIPEGKTFEPKWVEATEVDRLIKSVTSGLPVYFEEFFTNRNDLGSYESSNKLNWKLGKVRIMPNQTKETAGYGNEGFKVESKYVGKSVKVMPHPKTGELMVYVDTNYYSKFNPSVASEFFLQDIQSEIQHVAQAANKDAVSSSFMTMEADVYQFGLSRDIGTIMKQMIGLHEKGLSQESTPHMTYVSERVKAVESDGFRAIIEAKNEKQFEDAITALIGDGKSLPEDFAKGIKNSYNVLRSNPKYWKEGNWKHFQRILFTASKMLAPKDKNARVATYFNSKKERMVGFLTSLDIQQEARSLTDLLSDLPEDSAYPVSLGLSTSFAHWAPQVADLTDLQGNAPRIVGRNINGKLIGITSPEFTAEQIGSDIGQALFIHASKDNSLFFSPSGMIVAVDGTGRLAVRGGTDAGGGSPQPINSSSSRRYRKIGTVAQHDAKIADQFRGTWFKKDRLETKLYDLANSVIDASKSLDELVTRVWSEYTQDRNPLKLATALSDLANESKSQGARHMAQATMGLVLSLDEGMMRERFDSRFKRKEGGHPFDDGVSKDYIMNEYWDEAVANYNISAQTYWDVGLEKTAIESVYENTGSSIFRNTHKKRGEELAASLAEHRSVTDKFHRLAATNFSIGGVEALRPSVRDEVLRTGLAKEITINGKKVLTFEFSDSEAYLDTSSVQNQPHMLPFAGMPDMEKAYSDYAFEVKRRNADPKSAKYIPSHIPVGKETTLGKVFGHESMYYYYPEMRDVRVKWIDSHGGYATTLPSGEPQIVLGIRSFASAELNMKNDPDGMVFNNAKSLSSRFIAENPLASIILHEAQHILQDKANMQKEDGHIFNINKQVLMGHYANLLGIKSNFAIADVISKATKGDAVWSDAAATAAKDVNALADRLALAKDSPVVRHLSTKAGPMMKTALRNFAAFVAHEASEGRIEDTFGRMVLDLQETHKHAETLNEHLHAYEGMMKLRSELMKKSPEYSIKMHFDSDFRQATNALGLVRNVVAIEHSTPTQKALLVRQSLEDYTDMYYMNTPSERMARETEARRMLTQDELNNNPRKYSEDLLPDGSIMDIVDRAMAQSKVETPDSLMKRQTVAIDSYLQYSKHNPVQAIMKSIGGIAAKEGDNAGFEMLGKLSLVRYILAKSGDEIEALGRFSLAERGWVIEEGRLVLKTGNYIVQGDFRDAIERLSVRMEGLSTRNYNQDTKGYVPKEYVTPSAQRENGTYSLQDVVEIANLKVTSADTLSIGNSVIDAIMDDSFPPVFKVGDVMSNLNRDGVIFSNDATTAVMLPEVIREFQPETVMTKNDLLNILCFNHSKYSALFNASDSGFGVNAIPDSVFSRKASKETMRQVLDAFPNSAQQHIQGMMAYDGGYSPYQISSRDYRYGRFELSGQEIKFSVPALEKFITTPEDRVELQKIRERIATGYMSTRAEHSVTLDSRSGQRLVNSLNERMYRLATLIEPVLEKAFEMVRDSASTSPREKSKLAVLLLSEVEKSLVRVTIVEGNRGRRSNDGQVNIMVGGKREVSHTGYYESTALTRIHGKGSVLTKPANAGGMATETGQRVNEFGRMHTLGTLHGGFLFGESAFVTGPEAVAFERAESGLAVELTGSRDMSLSRGLINQSESLTVRDRLMQDSTTGTGVETTLNSMAKSDWNWSGEDFSTVVSRLRDRADALEGRVHEIDSQMTDVFDLRSAYERGQTDLTSYRAGGFVQKFINEKLEQGLTADASFDMLTSMLEAKKSAFNAQAADMNKIFQIQLGVVSRVSAMEAAMVVQRTDTYVGMDAVLPHHVASRGSKREAGTAIIRVGEDSFVDVDTSLADPNADNSATLPAFGMDTHVPRWVLTSMNSNAHNLEAVVTGIIGGTIFNADGVASIKPSTHADHVASFIERGALPDDVTTSTPSEPATQTVVSGLLFASQNVFAGLSKNVPDVNANFVEWALANRGPQVQADYQTNGLFGSQDVSQNPLLNPRTKGINTAVLGMMAAPFILGHNNLGFPTVSNGRIVHNTKVLEVGNYHEIVAFAETADMRIPEQKAKMKAMIDEWFTQVDKSQIDRILYESSSSQAVDGTLLRLNMAQTHALAKRTPERSAEIMEAHDLGATFGFDQQYGDSGVYGSDQNVGHGKSVISYLSNEIKSHGASDTFWRGYFMGVASLKGIKTMQPRKHGWRKYGVRAHDAVAGDSWLQYDRPSMAERRSVNLGMDVNSVGILGPREVPVIGSSFPTAANRKSFKDQNPQYRIQQRTYKTPMTEEMSMYDAIQAIATEQKLGIEGIDSDGAFGQKDAWYDVNSGDGSPIILGSNSGESTNSSLRVRRSEFSSRVRREIIVNRLANLASQLQTSKLAVQPARFSAARKPSVSFVGITSSDTRAGHFNETSASSVAWSGQSFVSAMAAERDKPRVGFAWTRLEDGRIMVNLAPDTNLGSYLDAVPSDKYVAPLGFSHRRTLGWDASTKTLIPMAHGRLLGLQDAIGDTAKNMRPLDRRIAHNSDLLHPAALKQYELAAKSVSRRALLGRLTNEVESAEFTRYQTQFGYGSNAVKNVREFGRALDFSEYQGTEPQLKQLLDLNDLMRTSSPENGYHTVILPKDAKLSDIQSAYFTLVAYHSQSLITNDRVGYYARSDSYRDWAGGGTGETPYFGHIDEFGGVSGTSRNTFVRALDSHRTMRGEVFSVTSGDPKLVGYPAEKAVLRGTSNFAKEIEANAQRASYINPDLLRDLTGAHERMLSSESGYFMPDVERAIAMNGDRSAVIDLIMPDAKHLQRFAWDDVKKNNVSIIRKSDKSGYMVGHDVITGVNTSGIPTKTRKVMTFRNESEALAYRDSVMSGGMEAEIPSMLFKEGGYAMKVLDQKFSHGKQSGKANITKGIQISDVYLGADEGTTLKVYSHDGTYHVGNVDTPFATLAEAKAAQEMLLRVETITGNAPKVERINLSTGGVGMYEHDIRRGLQFGIGGSPYQFAPRALSVLRTGLVPMLERNASGATKKVKKAVEVAKGGEWYEMFMENAVSKNEMRVLGLADFLHDNRENKLTKTEVAKFLWAMYPVTGRRSDQQTRTPYVASVNSPEAAIRSTARRFHEERQRQVKEIEDAIENAPQEEKGIMVAYLATIRKMHEEALQSALEQFYEKETAIAIIGDAESRPSVIHNATTGLPPENMSKGGRQPADVASELSARPHTAITPAVLETYRSVFNDAFAKAKLEAASRVAGFDFEIPDFRSNSVPVDLIMDWGKESDTTSKRTGTGSKDMVGESAKGSFNMQIQDGQPDYGNYTSGIGSYRWDTLHTGMGLNKAEAYLGSLKELQRRSTESPEEQARMQMQINSLERIIKVKRVAESRMSASGHKNTPAGTMQLGHARHSDVIVTAYHRANAPLSELSHSLRMSRDTMAVLGIEELQSDRYQGSTFGPMTDAYLGSSFEQVEGGKLLTELANLKEQIMQEEHKQGHIAAPMEAVQSSVKQKQSHAIYSVLAAREFEKASPLLKYILFSQTSESEKVGIAVNHDVKHPITKETAERYGIKEDYVPEIRFTEDYNGVLHSSLKDLIVLSHSEGGSNMNSNYWLMPYGLDGRSKSNGLMPMSQQDYVRYIDNPSPDNAGRLIASFGLQFNTEFMARLDELGNWYEIDGDRLGLEHKVDFDRIAMDTVLDYKRRLERSNLDPSFKRQALRIMTSLEQLYYEKGDGVISDHRTKWNGIHTEKHKVVGLSDFKPEGGNDMSSKRPYGLYNGRLMNFATDPVSHVPSLVRAGLVTKASAKANVSALAKKMSYAEKTFVELSPARALAFDIRLRSKILGVTPEQYFDALAWNFENQEGKMHTPESLQIMRNVISDPESVTHDKISNLGERAMIFMQSMDIDYDGSSGNPLDRNRGVHPFKAKTILGRIFEGVAPQITATYLANKPNTLLDGYRLKVAEIEAKIGKVADSDTYTYPDLIPLGEDGAYRGTMTSWYAMRALQSRKDAMVVMDARHHRTRYDSVNNTVGLFNLGGGIIAPINLSGLRKATFMATAYIMDVAKKEKAHGGLIEAMHAGQFPDAVMYNEATLVWNGRSENLCRHLEIAAEEIIQQLPFATHQKSKESMLSDAKATIQTIFLQNPRLRADMTLKGLVTNVRSKVLSREALDLDISASVTDGKDVIKRIVSHYDKPQGFLLSVPVGRTHGYASNYGAPLWHNRIYYAGMHEGLINQVSHDAFDIPEISMADEAYVVTDKKTGKVIAQGIKSFDEAQERAAQSAKYLGAVPIVSNFLKTFGKMGGYAMEGFMLTGAKRSEVFKNMHSDIVDNAVRPASTDMHQGAGMGGITDMTNKMGTSFGTHTPTADTMAEGTLAGLTREEAVHGLFGPNASVTGAQALDQATALHSIGLRADSSPEAVAAAMHRMTGFTGPLLVIRPKFPTANHKAEAKKAIINGIPFMSVKGVDKPEKLAKSATDMYKWYAGAKQPQQDEER